MTAKLTSKSILFFLIIIAVSIFFHFRSPNIPDADSFYHFRHSAIYLQEGITMNEFPWLSYSIIKNNAADIWYGFHLLLTPFTLIPDQILGIKVAGAFITFLLLVIFYWALKKLSVKKAYLWTLLVLLAAPNVLYHLIMTRPHVISVALAALLLVWLAKRSIWGTMLASFAITWLHLSFFWMVLAILLIFLAIKTFNERRFDWHLGMGSLVGLIGGWLLRPNPWGAGKIIYTQIFELLVEKQKGTPLTFGQELFPLDWSTLGANFMPFIILWLGAAVLFFIYRQKLKLASPDKTLFWSGGLLSLFFFLMTMFIARRAYDFWIIFGVMFIALVFSYLISAEATDERRGLTTKSTKQTIMAAVLIIMVFMAGYGIFKNGRSLAKANDPYEFQAVSIWIKNNIPKGETIYNIYWDTFPKLFFWNPDNNYASGMDPIFQFAYDESLYWKNYYWNTGQLIEWACGAPACTEEMLEDTYKVLKNDFGVRYIMVEKERNPYFYAYVEYDTRFVFRFGTGRQAIFELIEQKVTPAR